MVERRVAVHDPGTQQTQPAKPSSSLPQSWSGPHTERSSVTTSPSPSSSPLTPVLINNKSGWSVDKSLLVLSRLEGWKVVGGADLQDLQISLYIYSDMERVSQPVSE